MIEDALFRRICLQPDPSLAWLLSGSDRGIEWVDGPPVMPETYALRRATADGEEWVWYGGHNHGTRLGRGPLPPKELVRDGDRVLLGTSHGVLLTDPGRTRPAWTHVASPPHKLRFPSILGACFDGDEAVITLSDGDGSYAQPGAERTVRVDLSTGALRSDAKAPRQP